MKTTKGLLAIGVLSASLAILTCAGPAYAITGAATVIPGWVDKPLPPPTPHPVIPGAWLADFKDHPDPALGHTDTFNVYTAPALPAGWTLMSTLVTPFANQDVFGILTSQVYQYTDGHTLFAYQVVNTSPVHFIESGNVSGWNPGWKILDAGIWDAPGVAGDVAYDSAPKDVLQLVRNGQPSQPQFQFMFMDGVVEAPLLAGQTSSWFYMETDAPSWMVGRATVQNGGSVSPIRVLIPVPEPLTAIGLLTCIGALGAYLKRRRSAAA